MGALRCLTSAAMQGNHLPNADDILAFSQPLQMTRWWPPSSRLQMTYASSSTHLLQRLPPHPPHSLLQKTFPAEDPHVFPAEADFGPLAIFETRSLSTSLKKCRPGPKVY